MPTSSNTKRKNDSSVFTDPEKAKSALISRQFVLVGDVPGAMVPDEPGLYCIKLNQGVKFPTKFGDVRKDGIIYIGKASTSLRKRLWEQELNHKSAATFFRSLGIMLGYRPPKGSLSPNSRNFKFSAADTEKIRAWIRKSLSINYILVDPAIIPDVEQSLILEYRPLVNIEGNPSYSRVLKALRQECVDLAHADSTRRRASSDDLAFLHEMEKHLPKEPEPTYVEKPWYKKSNNWAWIVVGICFLAFLILIFTDDTAQKPKHGGYSKHPDSYNYKPRNDGPGDWKPDPNAAKNVREFIEKGGNADPAGDAIQDGDYHDLLDQNGGPEGF